MRGLLLLSCAAFLAGCLGSAPAQVISSPLGEPPLHAVLPDEAAIPEGFIVGLEQARPLDAGGKMLSRVYDHVDENATTHHALRLGVMRFASEDAAQEEHRRLKDAATTARVVDADRGVTVQETIAGDPAHAQEAVHNVQALGRSGRYVVWAGEEARGEALRSSPVDLVRAMLAKIDAGEGRGDAAPAEP